MDRKTVTITLNINGNEYLERVEQPYSGIKWILNNKNGFVRDLYPYEVILLEAGISHGRREPEIELVKKGKEISALHILLAYEKHMSRQHQNEIHKLKNEYL